MGWKSINEWERRKETAYFFSHKLLHLRSVCCYLANVHCSRLVYIGTVYPAYINLFYETVVCKITIMSFTPFRMVSNRTLVPLSNHCYGGQLVSMILSPCRINKWKAEEGGGGGGKKHWFQSQLQRRMNYRHLRNPITCNIHFFVASYEHISEYFLLSIAWQAQLVSLVSLVYCLLAVD